MSHKTDVPETEIYIAEPFQWYNESGPLDWYAVVMEPDDGIVAYAPTAGLAWLIANALRMEYT